MKMKNSSWVILLVLGTLNFLFHTSCSVQNFDCRQMKYHSLAQGISNGQFIKALYVMPSTDVVTKDDILLDDDRVLFEKNIQKKADKIKALEEFFCFYKNENVSIRGYSHKYGRSENRIRLSMDSVKFSVEVEALYSLTSMLFEDYVAISPVIIDKRTGASCNFKRKDMDFVYRIYRIWFRKMKRERFSDLSWPLKNSNYMWLGEDVVDNIETLIRREL